MILLVPLPDQWGEIMRPVMGPRHPPPPPGPGRRRPGNGGCVLVGCSVSTHGGENLATSADQGTQEEGEG